MSYSDLAQREWTAGVDGGRGGSGRRESGGASIEAPMVPYGVCAWATQLT